jgi:hypothetical protein
MGVAGRCRALQDHSQPANLGILKKRLQMLTGHFDCATAINQSQ